MPDRLMFYRLILARLGSFFSIPVDKPELAMAQFSAFSKQVPLLYLMLVANTIALSASHYRTAPGYLTIGVPCILYTLSVFRLLGWYRGRSKAATPEQAIQRLRGTIRFASLLGPAFTIWALSLYGRGDALQDAHVAFYMAITIVGCIFCLMHLRAAAVLLVFVVLGPFTLFFASTGILVFQAIAVNVLLVSAALLYILNIYYNDFAQLIASRKELLFRQADMQRLSDDNLRLANLDSLTGLSNRRWFLKALERDLDHARAENRQLAVGMIDLDGFKPINDAYGHAAGDKVLMEVAARLAHAAGDTIEIARLGGDEFGFILVNPGEEAEVHAAATRLIEALLSPYDLPEMTVRVGASVGVVLFPEGGQTAEELFEHADYALYHAKQTGRGQAVVFTSELATEIAYRSVVEQELKRADFDAEFSMVYQPLWSERAQMTVGFEALARWSSPVLGNVRPDVFITVAERSGIIGTLTEALLAKALRDGREFPKPIQLSCNLSAKDIDSPRTLMRLLAILSETDFDPARLIIELTETAILRNKAEAMRNLEAMRALGIGIAIDDFGVGQSGLGQIHRLPITKLKIDASFVADIQSSVVSRNIVRTILDLARNLDCACIVEGVETGEQAAILRGLGCDLMQGYHFGRPMPLSAALQRLQLENQALSTLDAVATVADTRQAS
jgi:diguanylate cyclase (GGDEF)-like protein